MPEDRTRYQVQIALKNGQAFTLVTFMPLQAFEEEMNSAVLERRDARFDGHEPMSVDESKVFLRVNPDEVVGYLYSTWRRPQVVAQPQPPRLVQ